MATFEYDIVIVGASFGGVSAALAAAAEPKVRVVLLESGTWVGGQATVQGVTRWDEARAALTESTGSTKSYRDLRDAIRAWYRAHTNLSAAGKKQYYFNPGFAETGPPYSLNGHSFAADPQVVRGVLTDLLKSFNVRLTVKFGATVTAVQITDGTVASITVDSSTGQDTYVATVFLDATDLGDMLPLCGPHWTIGAESKAQTNERDAEDTPHREFIQPITVPIALELLPEGESRPIPQPENYADIVKNQDFKICDGDIGYVFRPTAAVDGDTLWNYRRYIDARNFDDDRYRHDRTTINVGSNDYQKATIPTGDPATDTGVIEDARTVSIAYAYWLQNDCPRDEDSTKKGYPNLAIRTDAFESTDGTAPAPYIRESRRIYARTTIVQEDIDSDILPKGSSRARLFNDSCGIGAYGIDVHGATGPGTPHRHFGTCPFQIPLGSLLPKTLNNFIASCKNIGATHLTSGAYRVHPTEWAIGEAAGTLAAYCCTQNVTPGDMPTSTNRITAYQRRLLARGVPIFWWDDVRFERDAEVFAAAHLLGVCGILSGDGTLSFHPEQVLYQTDRDTIDGKVGRPLPWPIDQMTRAQAAVWICQQIGLPL